jgi:hypothetical protein
VRALVVLSVIGTAFAASAVSGASQAACGWRVVLDRPGAQLTALSAVADDDVWAVGSAGGRGVILHWGGRSWRTTRAAVFPLDVSASSARDVWVVGSTSPDALVSRPRSEHWDGRRWRAVPVPGGPGAYLRGIAGAWAVGAGRSQPLLVHWAGHAWRAVSAGFRDGLLHAIDLPWAVGTKGMTAAKSSEDPLVMRLSGGRWRPVTTPSLDSVDENLLGVDAVSTDDVWAVGSADVLGGRSPLVQRLQGGVWRGESIDGLPPSDAALLAVAAFGPGDAWAAGYRGLASQRTLLAHWDGNRWTQAPGRPGSLSDLDALSAHDIWAAGSNGSGSLVERYSCG